MPIRNSKAEIRQHREKIVVRLMVQRLIEAGWEPYAVVDGGEDDIEIESSEPNKAQMVIEHCFAVDESKVYFRKAGEKKQWVYLVMGNSPEEVISDHTCSTAPTFDAVLDKLSEDIDHDLIDTEMYRTRTDLIEASAAILIDAESELSQRKESGNAEDWEELEVKVNKLRAALLASGWEPTAR